MSIAKISLFTCNLANASKSPNIVNNDVFTCSPTIHVEMTQEDYRPKAAGSVFAKGTIPDNLILRSTVALNKGATTQNIVIRLFSSSDTGTVTVGSKAIGAKGKNNWKFGAQKALAAVGTGLGASKGAVWIRISKPAPMLFVCMHLPMNGKSADLGLNIRTKALYRILSEITPFLDTETSVFIGGDLNFRMTYDGQNQLTNELKKIPYLNEIPFVNEADKIFTCKFKSLEEKTGGILGFGKTVSTNQKCTVKRMTPVPNSVNPNAIHALQNQCGDAHRIPSRCDRFLYSVSPGKNIAVSYQKGGPLVPKSDHNAMWTCFDLIEDSTEQSQWAANDDAESVYHEDNERIEGGRRNRTRKYRR